MSEFVADTHSLIWRLTDSPRLGAAARRVFDDVDAGVAGLVIPAIAVAELVFAIDKHKLPLDMTAVITRWQSNPAIEIVDLRLSVVMLLPHLGAVPEMHDRLIVAEALSRDAPLLTRDPRIAAAGLVATVWE